MSESEQKQVEAMTWEQFHDAFPDATLETYHALQRRAQARAVLGEEEAREALERFQKEG